MNSTMNKSSPKQQIAQALQQHRIQTLQKHIGQKVIPEYQFHPERKWRFDFYLPESKTAIEVEGGAWTNGRHTRGKGYISDMQKYNEAQAMGIKVLRFTPDQLLTEEAYLLINIAKDI